MNKKPIQKSYARKSTAARSVPLARRDNIQLDNQNGGNSDDPLLEIQREQFSDQTESDDQSM